MANKNNVKKINLSLQMDNEKHKWLYEMIRNRETERYPTIASYLIAAVEMMELYNRDNQANTILLPQDFDRIEKIVRQVMKETSQQNRKKTYKWMAP